MEEPGSELILLVPDCICNHSLISSSFSINRTDWKETLGTKQLGINLPKEAEDLSSKMLMKEIDDRWKDTPCSWIGKINIVKTTVLCRESTETIYQTANTRCNLVLGIFCRYRTKNLKICIETWKTPEQLKQSWKRKMDLESGSLTSNYTI